VTTQKRLIEVAFPLEQTSLDSVHEKNVRHGHISTLHLWPARRPLAASRAALIATLLPDPGDKGKRDEILDRLAGTVVKTLKKKTMPSGKVEEIESKETVGGILHWGRESGPHLEWFRKEIRKTYGGRAPKVLDPFAGGGAIPLEAMRLGCEVTAVDINPVAWFILKCTLEYPQKLAGQTRKLPDFVLQEPAFMESYIKNRLPDYLRAKGVKESDIRKTVAKFARASLDPAQAEFLTSITSDSAFLEADLAWHVRAWGHWVLRQARKKLAPYYPTYAEFCSVKPYARVPLARSDEEQLKLVSTNDDGESQIEMLNAGFDKAYLDNDKNPRWIAKPTVACLWARTVKCKACRATIPLLKTRWLAKKDKKRVLLTMEANAEKTGVIFGIDSDVKILGGNPAQRREHDKRVGAGTMSRSGAQCPCCKTIMTMEDVRLEGRARRLGAMMTVVVVDAIEGKEYRLPTANEQEIAQDTEGQVGTAYSGVPFGIPTEPLASAEALGFRVPLYGLDQWYKLFLPRQLVGLANLVKASREASTALKDCYGTQGDLSSAIQAYLACALSRLLDFCNMGVQWKLDAMTINHSFVRFALPITWDCAEGNILGDSAGSYRLCFDRIATALDTAVAWKSFEFPPKIVLGSATKPAEGTYDLVLTDPPYYDAIPYSDLMDFFYVWLRRTLYELVPGTAEAFSLPLSPKWNAETDDGELIDDASRFAGDAVRSKQNYEAGMARSFQACHSVLNTDGRLVIVFAHKHPDAWETLVSAIIRAGFVVDGSWPIQTEQASRMRALGSAALASSVWLVCRKRSPVAKAGWDADVLKEMEINIKQRLREFWDAGIKGPDFVWAATGPALEAYSQYPAVKMATEAGALMTVAQFLGHVRRLVVNFVVGRVLTGDKDATDYSDVSLDDVTTYYLLHRNDFGLKDAPAGACILYAVSCGLSERLLADQYEILSRGKGADDDDEDDPDDASDSDDDSEESVGSGGTFKLKAWNQRKHRGLGMDTANGKPVPLIDQVHNVMHLWKAGDENKVNDYLDQRGLRRSEMFLRLLQALIEKSRAEGQSEECSILEKLSNHLRKIGATAQGALAIGG
jgi:adenine-specific DNA methylase